MAAEARLSAGSASPGAGLDHLIGRRYFTEGGFLDELAFEISNWPPPPFGPFLSCSSRAFPDEDSLAPLPPTPRDRIDVFIRDRAPPFAAGVDGLLWKRAVLDGTISNFLHSLRNRKVVLVGPTHLQAHQQCWRWPNFEMIEISRIDARAERECILNRIVAAMAGVDYPIVALQCGSMSAWMVARLFKRGVQAAVLDLGRALDFIDPGLILNQPWGAAHAETLVRNFCAGIPAWSEWRRRFRAPLVRTAPPATPVEHPIQFVERKSVDFGRLETELSTSLEKGQWANGGPGVRSLESDVAHRLHLAEDVAPTVVSSGTTALWTATAVAELRHGAPVRWVVCSFGFFSSAVGPLSNATIVDCDTRGMLSLDRLNDLDPDSYDGLIVTDLFGRADVRSYIELAEHEGKHLVIDAASGFDRELYRKLHVPVAFSFHHTKPYGFGEGGCVLTRSDEVDQARSISNYGHNLPRFVAPFCGNWKMADLQAAAIAQRHSTAPYWSPLYRLQYARINQIARRLGATVFPAAGGMSTGTELSTPSFIALLLEGAISQRTLDAAGLPFVARKYYRPLASTPTACAMYSRIVCIPVHRDMSVLSRDQIAGGIETIVELQEAS